MDGILVIDKEKNCTSRDVVNSISKILNTKKVGHTGTLDPIATGVLVITVGNCTKISEILTSEYKEYIASVTLDVTGNILKEENISIEELKIKEAIEKMKCTYLQEVPIYSAVKIKGKKLYEYARNNEVIELPKREVTIKKIELIGNIEYNNGKIEFKIKCLVSKGTYIRSLIRDLALSLNTVGIMTDLRRTKQGSFEIEKAYKISDIENNNYKFVSIEEALNKYKKIIIQNEADIVNGNLIDNVYNEPILILNKKNIPLALYKIYEKDNSKMKPWKMFKITNNL